MKKVLSPFFVVLAAVMFFIVSCENDDDEDKNDKKNGFKSLESPYLICAGRNPGGVGFDFVYDGEKGGANNIDSLTVSDFECDLKIRTIKGEKGDGSLGGAPFIQLNPAVEAINYSLIDTACKGIAKYNALSTSNIKDFTLEQDDASFDVSLVKKGKTGAPLMGKLQAEYSKLVIGEAWKAAAKNDIAEDEPVWVVKTREGRLIKFIVTGFPAHPAPTSTGYVAITWDSID